MKKLLLSAVLLLSISNIGFCQDNNPYDNVGKDFVKNYKIINEDYLEGKIKDVNQETINYYSKLIKSDSTFNLKDFGTIVSSLSKNSSTDEIIKNSNLSDFSKTILVDSTKGSDLSLLVEKVNTSVLSKDEKETVLSTLSIANSINQNSEIFPAKLNCWVCWVVCGAASGSAFGPLGTFVGGIIGAIIGGHEKDKP